MTTIINNKTSEILEVVKRTIYTAQVMAIGVFIPFLFFFGITYNTQPKEIINEVPAIVTQKTVNHAHTVDYVQVSPDKNS